VQPGGQRQRWTCAATAIAAAALLGGCFKLAATAPPDATDGGDEAGDDVGATGDASDAAPTKDARVGDAASDGTVGDDADAGDPCGLAARTDFYVDPTVDAGACTFQTITAAVAAAKTSWAPARTVHVAAGTYSQATGETLPIELRDGISLVGAGAAATTLVGAGATAAASAPRNSYVTSLSWTSLVGATLVVGDPTKPTVVSQLGFSRGDASSAGLEAIVCDRGSAESTKPPSPNTRIDHVQIDGFEVGLRVTAGAPHAGGCNALLGSSTVKNGNFGVVADGIWSDQAGTAVAFVSVQLGDGTTPGKNTFVDLDDQHGPSGTGLSGAGLVVGDGVTSVVVLDNVFQQDGSGTGDFGIWAAQHQPSAWFDVENNEFGPLVNAGVILEGKSVIHWLVDNSFHDVSTRSVFSDWSFLGVGLVVGRYGDPSAAVNYARRNTFVGNDVAVEIRSSTPLPTTDPAFLSDFGSATDPGGNTFRCNSTQPPAAPGFAGGDVFVYTLEQQQPNLIVPFEGNVWDHAPPTLLNGAWETITNGLDLYTYAADGGTGALADYADASTGDGGCPSGMVP
jgi:hypothetical protein